MSSKQRHAYRRDRPAEDLYSHAKPLPHQSPAVYNEYITLEQFRNLRDEYRCTSSTVYHLLSKFENRIKLSALLDENFDPKVHGEIAGYYPQKDFVYFAHDLPGIEHEIAHMVEINESKMLLPDWGLRIYRLEKETPSAIVAGMARESRVRGIQSHFFQHTEARRGSRTGNSLSNNGIWSWGLSKHLPYGKFKTVKDIDNWLDDLFEKTREAWCVDKIEALWNKRADIVLKD